MSEEDVLHDALSRPSHPSMADQASECRHQSRGLHFAQDKQSWFSSLSWLVLFSTFKCLCYKNLDRKITKIGLNFINPPFLFPWGFMFPLPCTRLVLRFSNNALVCSVVMLFTLPVNYEESL